MIRVILKEGIPLAEATMADDYLICVIGGEFTIVDHHGAHVDHDDDGDRSSA